MAGVWKPKFKFRCASCGWTGTRTRYPRPCPRCGKWRPRRVGVKK